MKIRSILKIFISTFIFVVMMYSFTIMCSAQVEVKNITDFGILSSDKVVFTIDTSGFTNGQRYYVKATADGKNVFYDSFISDAQNLYREFTTSSLSKGVHELTISVTTGLFNTVVSHTETVCVMNLYTPQFMDALSSRGINTYDRDWNFSGETDRWVKLISDTGIKFIRGGLEWRFAEGRKNDYTALYDETKDFVEACRKYGITAPAGSGWSNKLYPSEDGLTVADMTSSDRNVIVNMPKTPESLKGYANYIMAGLDYFKEKLGSTSVSISNEPNLDGFNQSIVLPNLDQKQKAGVYADLFKSTAVQLLKNGYDWADVGAMELVANRDDFAQLCFDYGAYPLMDIFTYHPYPYKNGFDPNADSEYSFYDGVDFYENTLIENGGWKQVIWTETGYTNYISGKVNETEAANGIVKMFAYADLANVERMFIYRLEDIGSDAYNAEQNYGIVTYDQKVKAAVPAVTTLNINTNGATVVGNIDLGYDRDTHCIVYNKDGAPVIVAWSDRTENTTVRFDGTNIIVEDLYGNVVSTGKNTVTLGTSPVYIKNADKKYFAIAAESSVESLNDVWADKYSVRFPETEKNEALNMLGEIENNISAATENSVLSAVRMYESLGEMVIELGAEGKLEAIEVSKMLYELYKPLEFTVNMYMTVYDGEIQNVTNAYEVAYNKAKVDYKDEIKTKQYSDEILNFAKKYSANVNIVKTLEENPTKPGVIAGWNEMTNILCGWFGGLSEYEEEINLGLLIQIPHYRKVAQTQQQFSMEMNLTNYSFEDFSGTIACYDEKGNFVGETEKILLPANNETITVPISIDVKSGLGYQRYNLRYVSEDGEEVACQNVDIKVEEGFLESVEAKYYSKTNELVIKGQMNDFNAFANREVTLLITENNGDIYADQTTVHDDGSYEFKFNYNGDLSTATLRVNMGGALITDTIIDIRYSIQCKITYTNQPDYIDIITEIENDRMFEENYQIIIASYKDGVLVDCYLSEKKNAELREVSTDNIKYTWPENADYVKIYAWTGLENMVPLGEHVEVEKIKTN